MFRQIAGEVQRYLLGSSSLMELEAWVVANTQRIIESGDPRALYVANQIDADIIDLGERSLDEVEFKTKLRNYIGMNETIHVELGQAAATTVSGASSSGLEEFTFEVVGVRTNTFFLAFK